MNKSQPLVSTIDRVLNCEFEAIFEVKPLIDMPIGDNSEHFRMTKGRNWVDFSIMNGEIAAYIWSEVGVVR